MSKYVTITTKYVTNKNGKGQIVATGKVHGIKRQVAVTYAHDTNYPHDSAAIAFCKKFNVAFSDMDHVIV